MSETVRAWIRAGSARSATCVVVMRITAMIQISTMRWSVKWFPKGVAGCKGGLARLLWRRCRQSMPLFVVRRWLPSVLSFLSLFTPSDLLLPSGCLLFQRPVVQVGCCECGKYGVDWN
jgi:hypothetical protein